MEMARKGAGSCGTLCSAVLLFATVVAGRPASGVWPTAPRRGQGKHREHVGPLEIRDDAPFVVFTECNDAATAQQLGVGDRTRLGHLMEKFLCVLISGLLYYNKSAGVR